MASYGCDSHSCSRDERAVGTGASSCWPPAGGRRALRSMPTNAWAAGDQSGCSTSASMSPTWYRSEAYVKYSWSPRCSRVHSSHAISCLNLAGRGSMAALQSSRSMTMQCSSSNHTMFCSRKSVWTMPASCSTRADLRQASATQRASCSVLTGREKPRGVVCTSRYEREKLGPCVARTRNGGCPSLCCWAAAAAATWYAWVRMFWLIPDAPDDLIWLTVLIAPPGLSMTCAGPL
mmetsp:Transcript_18880/g.47909  ORF Transcript_18880/g.47909 Transcript_18880/m.47909 type:complete len:234 (-) Transcript_18880:1075-1776(-)